MADDVLFTLYPDIVWAPFFERGKFRYWKPVGRARITIGKDGKPRTEFYNDAHVSGGSIWGRILPEGETPEDQPGEAQEQPKRPAPREQEQPADVEED
jgi:hypothetical protein